VAADEAGAWTSVLERLSMAAPFGAIR
jgi:hypothetical protein